MATQSSLQRKHGKYLWFALLGLGFQPDAAASSVASKAVSRHIILGPNMFDKPNKDAFYIVTHFLLEKLNPARFHESYRYCWPVVNNKEDAEFRKVTCAWLRELMDETANAGSKVVASLFLSPGGPKFTGLMLTLANHVMLQEMKTFATDGSWVPEAAAMPASSLDMAEKRLHMVHARFLKTAVQQDRFLQEYQRRAQLLVKSVKDLRADGAKYDELLKRHSSGSTQDGASPDEKTARVRSLWSAIDGMLLATKEDQHALDSVLKGAVDQYALDGTDRTLNVPRSLLERVEKLPHQLSSGNVYEAGQLNLLCVLELMNHVLQLLKEERRRVSDAPKPQLSLPSLRERCQQMARTLQDLHLLRQRVSKEEIPEVRNGIRELEAEWDRKWMDTLRRTPLVSFLNEDPALGFLSPMVPLSFEPAAEASYGTSIFCRYPAKLPEKTAESKTQDVAGCRQAALASSLPAEATRAEAEGAAAATTEPSSSSRANTSLDWLFDTPPSPPSQKTTSGPAMQASVRATARVHRKVAPTRAKTRILDMECDNLADQFADAVTTSPSEDRVKGLDLEGILNTLHRDPFSTRKQLPRTPESLILDVKSSWRKAVEEDEAEKRAAKCDGSFTGQLAPPGKPRHEPPSPAASSPGTSWSRSPPVSQQGDLLGVLDSPSGGTGTSAIRFSLHHETLPEMPSCDSLLSLEDDDVEVKSGTDDELLIPSLKQSPLAERLHPRHARQPRDVDSFADSPRTPERLLDRNAPGLDGDWLTRSDKSAELSSKVFSLDLDTLDASSPPQKREYSLPTLITFSPIDDMKC